MAPGSISSPNAYKGFPIEWVSKPPYNAVQSHQASYAAHSSRAVVVAGLEVG